MTLRAITDNGDFFAFDDLDVTIFVVIDFHFYLSERRRGCEPLDPLLHVRPNYTLRLILRKMKCMQ
jgi:hypothetical protein